MRVTTATCTKCRACAQNQAVKIGSGTRGPRKWNDVPRGIATFGRRQHRSRAPTPGPQNLNENPARRAFGKTKKALFCLRSLFGIGTKKALIFLCTNIGRMYLSIYRSNNNCTHERDDQHSMESCDVLDAILFSWHQGIKPGGQAELVFRHK